MTTELLKKNRWMKSLKYVQPRNIYTALKEKIIVHPLKYIKPTGSAGASSPNTLMLFKYFYLYAI